jgi:hypothetical protein
MPKRRCGSDFFVRCEDYHAIAGAHNSAAELREGMAAIAEAGLRCELACTKDRAAISRSRRASAPSVSRITLWIFIVVNGFLALVTLAALVGIWFGRTSAVRT